MLSKEEFIQRILDGKKAVHESPSAEPDSASLPAGFDDFDDVTSAADATQDTRFAQLLLEEGFGLGQNIPRSTVIRSSDAVARHIPEQVIYWPKTKSRPHHTILIEADITHRELLSIPAFKSRQLAHLDIAEDALARLAAEALEGFQRSAEGLSASALKGSKHDTLCVVSIIDERDEQSARLVCFSTFNAKTDGLETFFLTEQARSWDRVDARERLGLMYDRQFKKLGTSAWQEAFTTVEERKQAEKLLTVCSKKKVSEKDIQESILDLLDTIAKGFGLRKKPNVERRLQAFPLPSEHDIGIDSKERESKHAGVNPFGGVTLRDDQSRLLGYIVYPLKTKSDAEKLRQHLSKNNRFHNVLVVYPDANQASIELWQGREQLTGKLRKGQTYKDAADVVNLLSRFFIVSKAKVRNPSELAQELAYRARYLRSLALKQLESEPEKGPLRTLYSEFKKALVHDMGEPEFADAFSQTLTYSMLTARWVLSAQSEGNSDRFSRKEAMKRLSIGSRFLAEMFDAVLAMNLEDRGRLLWLVDDIADLLDRIDINAVFKPDGTDLTADPVIHFYEPFLAAYDAKIRMQRGAFYTPQPVVSYIVRSVHELLQTEFGLADGLADITTWGEMLKKHPDMKLPPLTDEPGEKGTISPDEPFVQILDPATGTGTFLVEVIDVIYHTLKAKWKRQRLTDTQQLAAWNDYVPEHLLPRLHAFELMMAPYAIAHMKVDLKLAETGYRFGTKERARIFLTNALEPWGKQPPLIGFDALAHEAAAVNEIKRHKRFTIVVGNPPYSKSSQNQGQWIERIMETYKTTVRTRETQIQALSDDYAKFIRFGHHVLGATGVGALGYITNNGYLDGPLFRDMRSALLGFYDKILILNLHGDSRKQASPPDGQLDENVFDIQQGVAVGLFTRSPGEAKSSTIAYRSVWGSRAERYAMLRTVHAIGTDAAPLNPAAPHWLFIPMSADRQIEFSSYWHLYDVFGTGNRDIDNHKSYGAGFVTQQDRFAIAYSADELADNVKEFLDGRMDRKSLWERFQFCSTNQWDYDRAKRELKGVDVKKGAVRCLYRPFDWRFTLLDRNVCTITRARITRQFNDSSKNIGLLTTRRVTRLPYNNIFVTNYPAEYKVASHDRNTIVFPLWVDVDQGENATLFEGERRANLNPEFLTALSEKLNGTDSATTKGRKALSHPQLEPETVFYYIYAVLSSPKYRDRYGEFLAVDFAHVPIPKTGELFDDLATLGEALVGLHLMRSYGDAEAAPRFAGRAGETIEKISYSDSTIWINKKAMCGFRDVPQDTWDFFVGGYRVCEKWLKDRKGRILSKDDVEHYQRIIFAVSETVRIMKEIDELIEKHGGWPGAFSANEAAS